MAAEELDAEDVFRVLRAGLVEGWPMDAEGCKQLASIPSREELLSRIAGVIQAPLVRLASVLQAPARNVPVLLKQVEEKKQD